MARFKLTHGTHQDESGRIYRAGTKDDVVESDRNLLEDFPNKFELLGDPEELHSTTKRRKPTGAAKVRRGSGGPRVNVGRSTETPPAKSRGKGKKARADKGRKKAKTAAEEEADEDGEDVTTEYPAAVERDLVVTLGTDNRYTVRNADGHTLTEAPVTKVGLKKLLEASGDDE